MSKTLNNEMRQRIASALLLHRFGDEWEALNRQLYDLARDCRDEHLGKELTETLMKLPDSWVGTTKSIRVSMAGKYCDLDWSRNVVNSRTKAPLLRIPPRDNQYSVFGVYDRGHPLVDKFEDLETRCVALSESAKRACAQATAALGSFRTVKALLAGWPEIKPFIPADALEEKTALPVVQTALLNDVFGLPVDEVAA